MKIEAKAKIISGLALSETMRGEIAARAGAFTQQTGVQPGLAVVLVGDDPLPAPMLATNGRLKCRDGALRMANRASIMAVPSVISPDLAHCRRRRASERRRST